MNIKPKTLVDVMYFREYLEGFSYSKDIERYKPLIRVQTFIDLRRKLGRFNKKTGAREDGVLPSDIEAKRRAVIRDWFRLALWYVRLRKAAQGTTPITLIEVEERIQRQKFFNGVVRVKQAKLRDYVENKGSDGETSSEVEDPMKELYQERELNDTRSKYAGYYGDDFSSVEDAELLDDAAVQEHFKSLKTQIKSAKNLRAFLQGIQFIMQIKGLQLNIFTTHKAITYNEQPRPNFVFDLDNLILVVNCLNEGADNRLLVKVNLSLKHMKMVECSRLKQ